MSKSLKRLGVASAAAVLTVFVAMTPVMATGGSGHGDGRDHGQHDKQDGKAEGKGDQGRSEDKRQDRDKRGNKGHGEDEERESGGSKDERGDKGEGDRGNRGDRGQGATPPRHDPVTVCHRLGNGGYHELTFDDSALRAHTDHGDIHPVPAEGCPATSGGGQTGPGGGEGDDGRGHTPVTVCHVLGNGGYHLLTFDQHALKAHVAHGDRYPVPAEGCDDATVPGGPVVPETPVVPEGPVTPECPAGDLNGVEVEGCDAPAAPEDEVLGAEEEAPADEASSTNEVLGAQAVAAANRAPAEVSPASGILPQTGAGKVGVLVVAGLALLAVGGVLLARRRPLASR